MNPKEVQKLTGMTASLNRFISRLADRCIPFFQLLCKWNGFEWAEKCASAFQQLKEYLSWPPIMTRPEEEEVLFAYISVAPHAVSLVLIQVDGRVQRLVARSRGTLSTIREGHFGSGTCYTKAPSLFSGPHRCGHNPTTSAITT